MNKFQDGFSSNSYDDLLAEYSGDALTNNPEEKPSYQQREPQTPTQRYVSTNKNTVNQPNNRKVEPSFEDDLSNAFKSSPSRSTPTRRSTSNTHYGASNSHSELPRRGGRFNVNIRFNPNEYGEDPSLNENHFLDKTRKQKNEQVAKEDNMSTNRNTSKSTTKKAPTKKSKKKSKTKIFVKKNGKIQFDSNAFKLAVINFFKARAKGLAIFGICIAIATIISFICLSCLNDVLAINREYEEIEVVLPNGVDTKGAIDILDDAGLIKNKTFCYVFSQVMGITDKGYLPGVYTLSPDMGVEKMLLRFKTTIKRGRLIEVVVPEGFTIDQIFARLEKNKVCSASSLYKVLDTIDFSEEYSFVKKLDNKKDRYHVLEGYMYPATYEFEQGSDPANVIRQFLNKFQSVWTEEYSKQAESMGMTMDEVITLASIIEKEGNSNEQFQQISSVLHNRLTTYAWELPALECDSTWDYIEKSIYNRVHVESERDKYVSKYWTYECTGLPVGAICNPGKASIEAALYPPTTKNKYFRHDKNGKIYLAETLEQHNANGATVNKINGEN